MRGVGLLLLSSISCSDGLSVASGKLTTGVTRALCSRGGSAASSRRCRVQLKAQGEVQMAMPLAPPMTEDKFATMQSRRVEAAIEFTMHPSWKQWSFQAAEAMHVLKERFPDVVVHRVIKCVSDPSATPVMQLRVEGKLCMRLSPGRGAVYLPMEQIGVAIQEARCQQRPGPNVYL